MNYLKNFIKGVATGVATLVPGVSGGTMAIILGIYDNLIHAVSTFFENWKKNLTYLMVVGLGGALGFLLFSRLLENAIKNYPYVMQFLFMGVIIGGLPVLYRKSEASGKGSLKDYIFVVLGFVIVLLLSAEPSEMNDMATNRGLLSMVLLFIAGIIFAIALVLPGISGSFMLLVLGLYPTFLNAVNTLNIPFLIPLGLGVVAGTFGSAKVIEKLLQKYPGKSYKMILGFVVGSLVQVFPGMPVSSQIIASIVSFIIGFAAIFWMGRKGLTE